MKSNYLNFKPMKTIKLLFMSMFVMALVVSCDDDDPAAILPEELITNVNVIFTNDDDPSDIVTLTAISVDGVLDPVLTVSGPFTADADYKATITITDEINDENILEEIVEEKDEHFFTYAINGIDLDGMIRDDSIDPQRTDGNYLGLETQWDFDDAASTGTLTLRLIHEPTSVDDEFGQQFEFGTASGGEFDINNTWNVSVQP